MNRREFIGVICGTVVASSFSAAAEQRGKVWGIGNVLPFTAERAGSQFAQLLEQRWPTSVMSMVAMSCC
jgi:hypothetical protein